MRIRSIRPEFWSSDDITALSWDARLIFIGLWSYVDDNGVGRDVEKLIVADLFPLEEDQRGALRRVHGALTEYSRSGLVTRYTVDGKPYVHVTTFSTNQVINRPSRARYPLPTCKDAQTHGALSEPSVSPHVNKVIGEGEKGRRGEVKTSSPATPSRHSDFDAFWEQYPRKVGKIDALKAYTKAVKVAGVEPVLLGVKRYAADPNLPERQFIPNPATWLNQGRWDDDPCAPRASKPTDAPRTGSSLWDRPPVGSQP